MAAHSTGSATISFGLVSIPIKLYSATQTANDISFNMLHKKCGSRVKQQYICPVDNEVVPREDMIKGYEFAKDRYVTFTADELKALEEKATQSIDITEFVALDKVDPVYFEKSYYLGPDKGGDKAYRLLSETMKRTKRAAVAKYAARGKMYLVLLRPFEGGLVMQQLHYADEIRSMKDVPLTQGDVKEHEVKLAEQLVNQITSETFDPSKYEDEVRLRMKTQIDKKVDGEDIQESPEEAPKAQIIDLMEALKASLAGGAERKPAKRAPAKPAAAAKKIKAAKK